jgi:hypothetical protein
MSAVPLYGICRGSENSRHKIAEPDVFFMLWGIISMNMRKSAQSQQFNEINGNSENNERNACCEL